METDASSLISSQDNLDEQAARIEQLERENGDLRRRVDELSQLVSTDPHTGLPRRRSFDTAIAREIERLDASAKGSSAAVCVLRLDRNYARIRNSRDRDRVFLFKTTQRIQESVGPHVYQSDRPDEFICLLVGVTGVIHARQLAADIYESVSRPHDAPAEDVLFGCHIGVALYPGAASTQEELYLAADMALDEAERRIIPYVLYTDDLGRHYSRRRYLEKELLRSVRNDFQYFAIQYQPLVNQDRRIVGVESLVRYRHPELGEVSPADLIPIAEESDILRFIGHWVLYHSCRQLIGWHNAGFPDLYVSVNLSPSQFKQADLIERVSGVLDSLDLQGKHLRLELTESLVMSRPETAARTMQDLRNLGVCISIDDFGTGYSSLSYLLRFPFETVKIDRSFIRDVVQNTSSQEIIRAIVSIARNIRMETVAEGVETTEQLKFLFAEGVQLIQGYYFSRPIDAEDLTELLLRGGTFADLPV